MSEVTFAILISDGVPEVRHFEQCKRWLFEAGGKEQLRIKHDLVNIWEIDTFFRGNSVEMEGPLPLWEVAADHPLRAPFLERIATKEEALGVHVMLVNRASVDKACLTRPDIPVRSERRRNPQMRKINFKVPLAVGKTTFERIQEIGQNKKETQALLEWMFAHNQQFSGLKLLDHDPTFTHYTYCPSSNSNDPPLFAFYAIRIIYAQDLGCEYFNEQFKIHLVVKPTNDPKVCITVIYWKAEDFYRWLDYIHVRVNDEKD